MPRRWLRFTATPFWNGRPWRNGGNGAGLKMESQGSIKFPYSVGFWTRALDRYVTFLNDFNEQIYQLWVTSAAACCHVFWKVDLARQSTVVFNAIDVGVMRLGEHQTSCENMVSVFKWASFIEKMPVSIIDSNYINVVVKVYIFLFYSMFSFKAHLLISFAVVVVVVPLITVTRWRRIRIQMSKGQVTEVHGWGWKLGIQ